MNSTGVPAHTELAVALIKILTGKFGLIVILTRFDVAGLPLLQVSLDVITTFT